MDLDAHVSSLLNSSSTSTVQRNTSSYKTATRTFPRVSTTPNQWDYKNIIEKLQVQGKGGGGGMDQCMIARRCWCCRGPSPVLVSPRHALTLKVCAVTCRTSSMPWRIA